MNALIVDGNNLAHRCRHAYNVSYRGQDTSVRYGFLRVLLSKMEQLKPEILIVCWDGGVPQYRRDRCPTYKDRDHADDPDYDVFLEQVREVDELLSQHCGAVSVRGPMEADDLMYHAACMLDCDSKVIFSGDADMLQAVVNDKTGRTSVLSKDTIISRDNFKEHSDGVPMEHWMDYRAMVGDSSDGYPGIVGVGPVTAKKLLTTYKTHTGIVNAANNRGDPDLPAMSPSVAEKVRKFGLRGFQDGWAVMRLDIDRFGARRVMLQAISGWQSFCDTSVRAYLAKYMMVSLIEGGVYRQFARLIDPSEYICDNVRVPVVASGERTSVGV